MLWPHLGSSPTAKREVGDGGNGEHEDVEEDQDEHEPVDLPGGDVKK